ncbi:hypothetical protein J2S74_001895 [Evansella vedderi]|uniref:histidine kinase n=1 Tax=Evansella vedderi TaxID=38282 RepID=A0ABT9ZUX5_9BACI|nr:hypothetical protein [Evansella vedderi]MDQ0254516.1 hypothetical protein [Evansella vedderi]
MVINSEELFTIVNNNNQGNEQCSGVMELSHDGTILHLCEKCKPDLLIEYQLQVGDSILQTPLAPVFSARTNEGRRGWEEASTALGQKKKDDFENWWSYTLTDKLDGKNASPKGVKWNRETERLVQQISLRYAHEILNALTPVYGILQMIKTDTEIKDPAKLEELLEIAQQEILKGKTYVNDFLNINFVRTPEPDWERMSDLVSYIETQLETQSPEFIPYIDITMESEQDKDVFIDKKQLRLVLQLLLKKWIDYADEPSTIEISFEVKGMDKLQVKLLMHEGADSLYDADDEFMYYLHLVDRSMEMNGGTIKVCEGITLEYSYSNEMKAEALIKQL